VGRDEQAVQTKPPQIGPAASFILIDRFVQAQKIRLRPFQSLLWFGQTAFSANPFGTIHTVKES
jgi:hypothetical protein